MAYWMPAFAGMTGDGLEPLLPSSGAAESEKQVLNIFFTKIRNHAISLSKGARNRKADRAK